MRINSYRHEIRCWAHSALMYQFWSRSWFSAGPWSRAWIRDWYTSYK